MFLHTYHPSPIIFAFDTLNIYWYGFLISVGIVISLGLATLINKKYKIINPKINLLDVTLYLALGGLIGARLYSAALNWDHYSNNLLDIFKVWDGGMSLHGSVLGGLLVLVFYSSKQQINPVNNSIQLAGGQIIYKKSNTEQTTIFWQLADLITLPVLLLQVIGRWGNYFNQELFGKPTNLSWGIPIDPIYRPEIYKNIIYFHPTFLYEIIWNLLLLVLLFIFIKKLLKYSGLLFMSYLILYSIGRFILEFIRVDETLIIYNLRFPQWVSLLIIIICSIMIYYKTKKMQPLNNTHT